MNMKWNIMYKCIPIRFEFFLFCLIQYGFPPAALRGVYFMIFYIRKFFNGFIEKLQDEIHYAGNSNFTSLRVNIVPSHSRRWKCPIHKVKLIVVMLPTKIVPTVPASIYLIMMLNLYQIYCKFVRNSTAAENRCK